MPSELTIIPYVLAYMTTRTQNGTEVLLSLRSSTAHFGAQRYALIGGKINTDESPSHALVREVREETGCVILPPSDPIHVLYFKGHSEICVAFVFEVDSWKGMPMNKEPEKHDSIGWYLIDDLPVTLLERHKFIIDAVRSGISYAEWGFD